MIVVVGCGGVGSYLIPPLAKVAPKKEILLYDGDNLEKKNLDRQLFSDEHVGFNKAHSLGSLYGIEQSLNRYYHSGSERLRRGDWLFCCADNHAARREVLKACDLYGARCVIACNEYTDAEAYFYQPEWAGTPNDPRVYYPVILTDHTGDPLSVGCQGEATEATPQLALANSWAANLALSLWWFHAKERPELPLDTEPHWPVHHKMHPLRCSTIKKGERV